MQLCVRRAVKHFPHRYYLDNEVKRLREAADDPSRVLPGGANLFQGLTEKSPVDQHKNVPDLAQPEQPPYAANLFLRRFFIEQAAPSEQSSL